MNRASKMRKKHRLSSRTCLKIAAAFLCVPIVAATLCGCIPYKELKDTSIVEGMGIDWGPDGYEITFQIYKPQKGGDNGGGGGGNSGGGSSTISIIQSTGATIFDALRNATLQNGRKLYFSNVRAYIISEDACKNNLTRLLDFMERNHEIRPKAHLFIAKGKAEDILMCKKDDEIVPATNLEEMAKGYTQTSKIARSQLIDIYKDISTGITDEAIAAVTIKETEDGSKIVEIDGTAVFHKNRLVGYLNKSQTRGLLFIKGKANGGVIVLNLPNGGTANMELRKCKTDVTFEGDEKSPVMKVKINFTTNLTEVQSSNEYAIDDCFVASLKKLQDEAVISEARSAIDVALSTYGADIFGFGLNIFENKPDIWRKIGKNWSDTVKNIKVEITADSMIDSTGLTVMTSTEKKSIA